MSSKPLLVGGVASAGAGAATTFSVAGYLDGDDCTGGDAEAKREYNFLFAFGCDGRGDSNGGVNEPATIVFGRGA